MSEASYLSLWTKYLPVIRILLKRSVNEQQQVTLGKMELQSVDNRKNVNYSFDLAIAKGKVENNIGTAAICKDLFYVLSQDAAVSSFMNDKHISIRMTKTAQLTLKTQPA